MTIQEILLSFNLANSTPQKLDERLVEFGEVYKFPIMANAICEISLLQISPHSKIKEHKHNADSELYFFINEETYSICEKGGKHKVDNNSDEWIQVLSIKTKYSKQKEYMG